jgi:hypothetical protein
VFGKAKAKMIATEEEEEVREHFHFEARPSGKKTTKTKGKHLKVQVNRRALISHFTRAINLFRCK